MLYDSTSCECKVVSANITITLLQRTRLTPTCIFSCGKVLEFGTRQPAGGLGVTCDKCNDDIEDPDSQPFWSCPTAACNLHLHFACGATVFTEGGK